MNVPEKPYDTFVNITWEVATYIIFIGGIYIIELYLKPGFGSQGMPVFANWIFYLLELAFFITILQKLLKTADGFLKEVSHFWTVKTIVNQMNSNFDRTLEVQPFHSDETPASTIAQANSHFQSENEQLPQREDSET